MIDASNRDIRDTISRYRERYKKYRYSPLTLGWDKGKQRIRFDVLTSEYCFSGKKIIDIGCGFGDLIYTLNDITDGNFEYIGIDLVPELIEEAKQRHPQNNINFIVGDFFDVIKDLDCDYIIASGVFNHKLHNGNEYKVIEQSICAAMRASRDGIAFDFLSDKVDYKLEHTFHSAPEQILSLGYKATRNVILKNDYMPFEFSIFLFKDESFATDDTAFHRFKNIHVCNDTSAS